MVGAEQRAAFGEITSSVKQLAQRAGTTPERAFAAWYAIHFLDVDEDEALEAASVDGGGDQGIDFLHVDEANERVILLQAHLPQEPKTACQRRKLDSMVTAIPLLDSPDTFKKAGRADLAALAESVNEKLADSTYDATATLLSLGTKSSEIARALPGLNGKERFKPFRIGYVPFEEICDQYASLKDLVEGGVAEDSIRFAGDQYFVESGDFGKAYVGSLPASELSRLYDKYKERLFARNVRLYLGTRKGSINEQTVDTATNSPGKFWAMNNGVTIVADTITLDASNNFNIARFSVVNGCQTTVSLARASASPKARVLTRLVAAKQAIVSDIVRFNNTQNAIKIWTVRAADQIQKKLTEAFKGIGISYAPKPSSGGRRSARGETIELDRLAQYLAAGRGLVIEAVKEKSELFDRHYQSIFPLSLTAEDAYQAWIEGSFADTARQKRLDALASSTSTKEILPFLGVAGTYWITYCCHRLASSFNHSMTTGTLKAMANEQYGNAVLKYVELAIDMYFDLASDTYEIDEFGSARQAMRSAKFFQKISQKLDNKIASLKAKGRRLPDLEAALRTVAKTK